MKKADYLYPIAATVVLTVLTFALQTYRMTLLEEDYIFLFDSDYVVASLSKPGGVASLLSAFLTQHFIYSFASPLITGFIYGVIVFSLSAISIGKKAPIWVTSLSGIPAMCLWLCFESSAFEYQGLVAVMLNVVLLWVYTKIKTPFVPRIALGTIFTISMYWCTGSASALLPISMCCYDVVAKRKNSALGLLYIIVFLIIGYLSYYVGLIPTMIEAFTPAAYYDMGATYYMMIYSLCSVPLIVILSGLKSHNIVTLRKVIIILVLLALETIATLHIYSITHSKSYYENCQQRYYARHDMWDEIINMPYDGAPTPYTSYRFLALAQKGRLDSEIMYYRPFISYLFENKPKVKKRDQQIYSDIYYACRYMPAARRSAFDTDIVTPGKFNPYETQKLAAINMAYGDYEVAEKLLSMLDKTLYYSRWAANYRRLLYDDDAISSDPLLGPMRRAIPAFNVYLSPKGMMRDLKNIVEKDSSLVATKQFYNAFLILTHQ